MSDGRLAHETVTPASVGVSLGTAVVLGLSRAPSLVAPTTAYLMVGERCSRDCAYCAQAHSSVGDPTRLSRVDWPRFPIEAVLKALAEHGAGFQRICIQSTSTPDSFAEVLGLVQRLNSHVDLPLDVSALPPDRDSMEALFAAGVDHLGFGLDAATEAVFRASKGPGWRRYQDLMRAAAQGHPGQVAAHLIAGLGETEDELCHAMQAYHDLGIVVGLFAFTPLPGTRLAQTAPPALGSYRRLQVARYLIAGSRGRAERFTYTGGVLRSLGATDLDCLADGGAFRTSGCPGCNRPFYNERPSGPLYNYPRPLAASEAASALAETGIFELASLAHEARDA